jgi:hypothetical protein
LWRLFSEKGLCHEMMSHAFTRLLFMSLTSATPSSTQIKTFSQTDFSLTSAIIGLNTITSIPFKDFALQTDSNLIRGDRIISVIYFLHIETYTSHSSSHKDRLVGNRSINRLLFSNIQNFVKLFILYKFMRYTLKKILERKNQYLYVARRTFTNLFLGVSFLNVLRAVPDLTQLSLENIYL